MPAVLAELAFVDNKNDANKIATPAQKQSAAEAIYQGILDYYEARVITYLLSVNTLKEIVSRQSLLFINVSLYFRHVISFNFI